MASQCVLRACSSPSATVANNAGAAVEGFDVAGCAAQDYAGAAFALYRDMNEHRLESNE